MTKNTTLLLLSVATGLLLPTQPGFAQQDSLLQRIYQSYNRDDCSNVIEVMTSEVVSSLTASQRAFGEILHGACLFGRGDSTNAFAAFTRAVAADASVTPDTTFFAPDRVAMYRRARNALPVANVELVTNEFHPFLQERAVFRVSINQGQTTEAPSSSSRVRVLLVAPDGSTHLLQYGPADRVVRWNGRLGPGGPLAPSGEYQIVIETSNPRGGPTVTRKTLKVDVIPRDQNLSLAALPPVPALQAESTMVFRPDVIRKRSVRNRGLIAALAGTGVATLGYLLSNSAADGSSPQSMSRYASAGLYTGGVAIGVFGTIKLFQGLLGDYRSSAIAPDEQAIAMNQSARNEYRVHFRQAVQHNHSIISSLVMRLRIEEGPEDILGLP